MGGIVDAVSFMCVPGVFVVFSIYKKNFQNALDINRSLEI